ncbi:hypothetical protein RB653_009131 [Dictyostelium firmibasis]|uniref:Flavin-containing monooxygenase n=1 Tax=Dictyostelium firmibasis TaxID=79012 RepID=A0AAN7U1W4_9MYCE
MTFNNINNYNNYNSSYKSDSDNNSSNGNNKTVAIIGFGPAGICSTKSCIENGLIPTAFEMSSDLGGVWSKSNGKVWDNLTTNVTRYTMSFSDFLNEEPNDEPYNNGEKDIYPHHSSIYNYLNKYTNHFNLIKHVKFNSKVIKVEKVYFTNDNFKLKVTWKSSRNGEYKDDNIGSSIKSEIFDFLIVCTGVFLEAQECDLYENELKNFKGKIIHSKDYKNNNNLIGKRIVVLGSSISGCEISSEVSKVTSKCFHVGHEINYVYNKHLPDKNNRLAPLDCVIYQRKDAYERQDLPRDEFLKIKNKLNKKFCPKQDIDEYPNSKIAISPESKTLGFVISSEYVNQVENGSISVFCGNQYTISSSSGKSVTFSNFIGENHTVDNIDEIIICNGYKTDLSFFEKSILDTLDYKPSDTKRPILLYRNTFAKDLKNIGFASFFRGLFFCEMELMTRWMCLVFSGKHPYPNKYQYKNGIKDRNFKINFENVPQFLIAGSTTHCDFVALEIGVLPDFEKLKKTDPKLYDLLWNGYFTPATYRLVGPGSNPKLAKEIIEKVNNNFNNYVNKINKNC